MMRRILLVMSVLTICVEPDAIAATRTLHDTRYAATKAGSSITFEFDAPGRVLHKRLSDNEFRLTFPGTTTPGGRAKTPLVFPNGQARSVGFDSPDMNTVRAYVTLRSGASYSLRREGHRFVVDIKGSDTAAVAPIDIPALALKQVDDEKKAITPASQTTSTIWAWIPLVVAAIVAFVGTVALLLIITRQTARQPKVPQPAPATTVKQAASPVDQILEQARIILKEKATQAKAPAEEVDDKNLSLARTLRRGRGEVELARKIEQRPKPFDWQGVMSRSQVLKGSPAVTAKKLGVGRGELHLADSLHRLQEKQERKG